MKHATTAGITLRQAVQALETLAPPAGAEAWDNTGLLLAPSRSRRIQRIMLTIDCTAAVAAEAVKHNTDLLVAYHPPLFGGIHHCRPDDPNTARLLPLLEHRIAVYSPHTALDQAEGGVNDWLAEGVQGNEAATVEPIETGPGRLVRFAQPIPPTRLIERLKHWLRLPQLRVAPGTSKRIRHVALCAGAGHEALQPAAAIADAYVTGEMKHHDILAAQARGIHVLLSEHTHTERGYLPRLKQRLRAACPGTVEIRLARSDRDPVRWL
jgi:dinuclear metal center YbgI/SA1388 family protein